MPSIPALRRQRQAYFCEFKASSLVYRVNSRTFRAVTQRNSSTKTKIIIIIGRRYTRASKKLEKGVTTLERQTRSLFHAYKN